MASNLEKYKNDLYKLIENGKLLQLGIQKEINKESLINYYKKKSLDQRKISEVLRKIPSFKEEYQSWYSESLNLIKKILPDRVNDFKKLYEKDGIEKYLVGSVNLFGNNNIIKLFNQQLSILKSAKKRFESSLFDIKYLLQADLFDSELDAAEELNKNGFVRCGGAIAGVVLEKHLAQVCENYNIKISKKKPTINDYNENLKNNEVIDLSTFRNIQYLTDIRNKCAHNAEEPSQEKVKEMIEGVNKIINNVN